MSAERKAIMRHYTTLDEYRSIARRDDTHAIATAGLLMPLLGAVALLWLLLSLLSFVVLDAIALSVPTNHHVIILIIKGPFSS